MSLSNSRAAYIDCYELFDRALDEPRGIRAEVIDFNKANYLRMRLHHARQINRDENAKTYPDPEAPLHGRSVYDIFAVRIEEASDRAWVYLDKQKVEIGRVESIPEQRQIEAAPEMLQIEGPKPEPFVYDVPDVPEIIGKNVGATASFEITNKPTVGIRRR